MKNKLNSACDAFKILIKKKKELQRCKRKTLMRTDCVTTVLRHTPGNRLFGSVCFTG